MKRALKVVLFTTLVLAVIAAVLTACAMIWGLPHDGFNVVIDGESLDLGGLGGLEWLLAFGGILVAGLIVLIVVPLALLLGLGVPALLAGLVLIAGLVLASAALALVFSPVLVAAGLIWWAVRRSRRPAPMPAADGSATIAG